MPAVDRNGQTVELKMPHLWWVLRGSLRLTVRDGDTTRSHHIVAGAAVSVDRGVRVSVHRSADAVALGFPLPEDAALPFTPDSPVTVSEIPADWYGTLITRFADSLNYLSTPSSSGGDASLRPRMPVDSAARAAARILMTDLSGGHSVEDLAEEVFVSPSTLRRRFLAETGLSVGAWRGRLRVSRVAELLDGGSSVESAAHRVGLSSAAALCHLVRRHTGMTPGQLRDRPDPAPSVTPAEELHTWPRVNRFHVLIWAWRGSCRVSIGETTTDLGEGELIWLPAGLPNHVAMNPGGLVLPVGARAGRPAGDLTPTVIPGADAAEDAAEETDALLAALGREYDPVSPEQTDLVDRQFYSLLTGAGDTHGSHLLRRLTEDFRRHPDIDRTLPGWAERLDCTTGELTEALDLFGAGSLREWAAKVRMAAARQLLASGIPVGAVARHLGYSGTASFSHVFRRTHGVPPGRWHGYV
jgi:AraC-like DNA-binding protein/quercetin dioxygenase-like cupin family protein